MKDRSKFQRYVRLSFFLTALTRARGPRTIQLQREEDRTSLPCPPPECDETKCPVGESGGGGGCRFVADEESDGKLLVFVCPDINVCRIQSNSYQSKKPPTVLSSSFQAHSSRSLSTSSTVRSGSSLRRRPVRGAKTVCRRAPLDRPNG